MRAAMLHRVDIIQAEAAIVVVRPSMPTIVSCMLDSLQDHAAQDQGISAATLHSVPW
jgi:hypothetical protein